MALVSINWHPSTRQLRQFAFLGVAALALVAGWWYRSGAPAAYLWSLLGVAAGVGLLGVVWPECLRQVYVAVMFVTFPIGWAMSYVVLGLIYFGVFTPVALCFRLVGRDALQRRLEPATASCWQDKQLANDPQRYLQQF